MRKKEERENITEKIEGATQALGGIMENSSLLFGRLLSLNEQVVCSYISPDWTTPDRVGPDGR